jgi:hypothetical protein
LADIILQQNNEQTQFIHIYKKVAPIWCNLFIRPFVLNMINLIDFTEVENAISKLFNNINVKIDATNNPPSIKHDDITDQLGCFKQFITNPAINFHTFRQMYHRENKYWGAIFLNYETTNGFDNGELILTCWYNNGKWELEPNTF